VLIEGQLTSGNWTDPERGKVRLGDHAAAWITERPRLRPRTMDLYRWLLGITRAGFAGPGRKTRANGPC
jgi:hypothetical protein